MSNTAVINVLKYSNSKGVQRLILLALAAHCNEGRNDLEAWPSITRLAEFSNVLRPSASRAMKELIKSGEVVNTGKTNGRNTVYKIVLTVTPCYVEEELSVTPRYTPVTPRYAERNTTLHKLEGTRIELEYIPPIVPQPYDEIVQLENPNSSNSTGLEIPSNVSPEIWKAYVEMRKVKKKPMTKHAEKLAFRKLEAFGLDADAALEQSIFNSWIGIFEVKNDKRTYHTNKQTFAERDAEKSRENSQATADFWERVDAQERDCSSAGSTSASQQEMDCGASRRFYEPVQGEWVEGENTSRGANQDKSRVGYSPLWIQ